MHTFTCQDCSFFLQHYALDNRKLFRVYCGHCKKHPTKRKRPDTLACENFIAGTSSEDAFVTKEYLSKELLQHLLRLDLLPNINDL